MNKEIEVRFLEIDKEAIIKKLRDLGAKDCGEEFLKEIIFYDKERKWLTSPRAYIRIRTKNGESEVTYKENPEDTSTGAREINFGLEEESIPNFIALLDVLGIEMVREQEKKRHTFLLDGAVIDIDLWPKIPTYLEIEGDSVGKLQEVAEKLELDWKKREVHDAAWILEHVYNIYVYTMRYFTFSKFE